ncbi:amidohydrolase [Pseudonocardia acaciae]|uniref:amidohydrolase n=1 Tax=Pseudonocardia acaciae TaxID=551276 RepID=UPI00048BE0D2|nr:amidohydrolase [Pseudonocardia acaciae]
MNEADLIFHGGPVYTMDTAAPATDAVAVRAGRVVATGDDVPELVGRRTEVVNLAGRALLPGFQDAHAHPVAGGLQRMACHLDDIHGLADYQRRIRDYARAHPELDWITGAGWYGDAFPGGFPTRHQLDEVTGPRPALFDSHDGHGAWANSEALRRAGITSASADPPDGRIPRDDTGEPTGMLVEGAARLVGELLPRPDAARLEQAVRHAQRYLHGLGITGWQDAAVGEALGIPDSFDTYRALAERGELTARVVGALWWRRGVGAEQVDELVRRRALAGTGRFRATAVKIMQDGVCENLTAAVLDAYRGHPHERGLSFLSPSELADAVAAVHGAGFDAHIHAVGDRAVRDCLDAITPVGADAERRHQIAHIDLIHPEDIGRMRELGVIANVQPLWARQDPVLVDTKLPYLTDDQRRWHFAFGALAGAGVRMAMGSDWPVSSPNPMWGVHVAVNRTAPARDPHAGDTRSRTDPLLPEQAISVDAALAAYTRGAAIANHLERDTGTITVGKAADLVVLDHDPHRVPPREIGQIEAAMTFVDGRVVHHP